MNRMAYISVKSQSWSEAKNTVIEYCPWYMVINSAIKTLKDHICGSGQWLHNVIELELENLWSLHSQLESGTSDGTEGYKTFKIALICTDISKEWVSEAGT